MSHAALLSLGGLKAYSSACPSSPSAGGGMGLGGSSTVSTSPRSYSWATGGGGSGTKAAFFTPQPTYTHADCFSLAATKAPGHRLLRRPDT